MIELIPGYLFGLVWLKQALPRKSVGASKLGHPVMKVC